MPTDAPPVGIEPARVSAWLLEHVPEATAPFVFEPIVGGGSNLTFRVFDAGGHQWALRRPPVGPLLATAHDMGREVRIIAALANSSVAVPACVAFCEDPAVTGAPFYVMEFVDGLVLRNLASTEGMSRSDADAATDSLIDTQIAFHTLDLEAYGLDTLARHGDYLGRQLARWRRQVEQGQEIVVFVVRGAFEEFLPLGIEHLSHGLRPLGARQFLSAHPMIIGIERPARR